MQHVFEASTPLGLATLVALIRRDGLGARRDRTLVVVNAAAVAEAVTPLHERPELAELLAEFGRTLYLNDLTAPEHPLDWSPAPQSHHERVAAAQLVAAIDLDEAAPHALWLASVQGRPGRTLGALLPHAEVHVVQAGLHGYGPTRGYLDETIAHRVERVHHLELLPGTEPYLLREFGVGHDPVAVRDVLGALPAIPPAAEGSVVLVVAQDLAEQEVLDEGEAASLLDAMVTAAVAAAAGPVLVRPHPRGIEGDVLRVLEKHRAVGADVRVLDDAGLVEQHYAALDIALVVSCYSTALATARALGIATLAVGTRLALQRIKPFTNEDRIAIVLSDLIHPTLAIELGSVVRPALADPELERIILGLTAMAMQPANLGSLRGVFDAPLGARGDAGRDTVRQYVAKARLDPLVPPPAEYEAPASLAARAARRLRGR